MTHTQTHARDSTTENHINVMQSQILFHINTFHIRSPHNRYLFIVSATKIWFSYHKIVISCRRRNTKANSCTRTGDTGMSLHLKKKCKQNTCVGCCQWLSKLRSARISFRERETKSIPIAFIPHFNLQLIYADHRNSGQTREQRLFYARSIISIYLSLFFCLVAHFAFVIPRSKCVLMVSVGSVIYNNVCELARYSMSRHYSCLAIDRETAPQ